MEELSTALDLVSLRKLRFEGVLSPHAATDWIVKARLGATVTQACVVTLDPVTTRIEEDVVWQLVRDWREEEPVGEEVEMPEDETRIPLGDEIDLMALMQEALALALPAYPRSADARAAEARVAPPGVAPLTDQEVKPFAGLAELKKRMDEDASDPE